TSEAEAKRGSLGRCGALCFGGSVRRCIGGRRFRGRWRFAIARRLCGRSRGGGRNGIGGGRLIRLILSLIGKQVRNGSGEAFDVGNRGDVRLPGEQQQVGFSNRPQGTERISLQHRLQQIRRLGIHAKFHANECL